MPAYREKVYTPSNAFQPGLFDDPLSFTQEAVKGVGLGVAKVGFDALSVGVDIGNAVLDQGVAYSGNQWFDDSDRLDIGKDFWEVYEALDTTAQQSGGIASKTSGLTSGVANTVAFAATSQLAASKLAKLPGMSKLFQSSSKWDNIRGALYTNTAGGAVSDLLHGRAEDTMLVDLIPKEYHNDLTRWMMDREGDSFLEGKLKLIMEGAVLGVGADVGIGLLGKTFRTIRSALQKVSPDDASLRSNIDNTLSSGSGELAEADLKTNTLAGNILGDDLVYNPVKPSGETYLAETLRRKRTQLHQATRRGNKRQVKKANKKLEDFDRINNLHDLAEGTDIDDIITEGVDFEKLVKVQDMVSAKAAMYDEAEHWVDGVLRDPASSIDEKELAKSIQKTLTDTPDTYLNPKVSGSISIQGAIHLEDAIKGASKLPKADRRSFLEQIKSVEQKFASGEGVGMEKQILDMAKGQRLDHNSMVRQVKHFMSNGHAFADVLTGMRVVFNDVRDVTLDKTAKLLAQTGPIQRREGFDAWVQAAIKMDEVGNAAAGGIGAVGRMLGNQRIDLDTFGAAVHGGLDRKILSGKETVAELEAMVKAKGHEAASAKRALGKKLKDEPTEFNKSLDKLQSNQMSDKELEGMLKTITKKGKNLGSGDMNDLVVNPRFTPVAESFVLGSMLSGPRTLFGSVFLGGAAQAVSKNILIPAYEGAINNLRRVVGKADGGQRMLDGLTGTMSMVRSTGMVLKNFYGRNEHRVLKDILHTGFESRREGVTSFSTMSRSELKEEFTTIAAHWRRNDLTTRASILELSSGLASRVMAVQNTMVRGIENLDTFFKGLSNESQLAIAADRAWFKDASALGEHNKEAFIRKYTRIQREMVEVERMGLVGVERVDALDTIFKDVDPRFHASVTDSLANASTIGRETTLQQSTKNSLGGDMMRSVEKAFGESPAGRMGLLMTFPFRKTPVNAVEEVLELVPGVNLFTARARAALKGEATDDEVIKVVAKMGVGLSILGSIATLTYANTMQGTIAPNERAQKKAEGIPEHSILIGDKWVQYDKLGPVAALISSAADFVNHKQKDPSTSMIQLFAGTMAVVMDDSHFATIGEFVDIIQDEDSSSKMRDFVLRSGKRMVTPAGGMWTSIEDFIVNERHRSIEDQELAGPLKAFRLSLDAQFKESTFMRAVNPDSFSTDVDVLGHKVYKSDNNLSGKLLHLFGFGNQGRSDEVVRELKAARLIPNSSTNMSIEGMDGIPKNMVKDVRKNVAAKVDKLYKHKIHTRAYQDGSDTQRREMLREIRDEWLEYYKFEEYKSNTGLQLKKRLNRQYKIMQDRTHRPLDFGSDEYFRNTEKRSEILKGSPAMKKKFKDEILKNNFTFEEPND